ncbi:LysM peptidoglycan-binding domain-containing protein [Sphingobacteriales bacterium UPWRP_1]|nr:hypothetical protein B6N25_15015 [Sphingobacteriales bacterium TSM_CSS]PSJ74653.1 LysM peptidoglycan-binding domain-containing protein [Sphingobacteriales bacterium UPWRP_1]
MKNLQVVLALLVSFTISVWAQQQQGVRYTVKTGDTLYKLASVYGVSVDDIKLQNPAIVGNKLNVGEVITLPPGSNAGAQQGQTGMVYASVPTKPTGQTTVFLNNDAIANANATQMPMANKNAEEPIARAVTDILAQPIANIPAATKSVRGNAAATEPVAYATIATNATANTTNPAPKITNQPPAATATPPATTTTTTYTKLKPVKHKVKEKETLYSIAKLYSQPMATLQNWNNLTDSNIKTGQEIIIDWIMPTGVALVALELAEAKADPAASSIPPFQKKYMEFETDTTGQYRLKFQTGAATWFDDSGEKSSSGNLYCLHKNAPPKTVVKVTNPINSRSVYLMVIEKLPDTPQNDNVLLSMTLSAAKRLSITNDKLIVESRYYMPR